MRTRLFPSAVRLAAALLLAATARADTFVVSKGGAISTIQAGIDAAGSGDVVVVKAGIYLENVLIDGKEGLKLRASGKVVIDARPAGGAGGGPGIRVLNSDGVTIDGFDVRNALDAGGGGPAGYGIECQGAQATIEDCEVQSCDQVGVSIVGDDARVEDCTVVSCPGALEILGDDALVSQCEVRAMIGAAIYIQGTGARVQKTKVTDIESGDGIVISGDFARVEKCKLANTSSHGVAIEGASAQVLRCEFEATGLGITAHGPDCIIDDNEFRNCPGGALSTRGDNPTITDNEIDRVGNRYQGIYVDEATTGGLIEDNQVAHSSQEGIGLAGSCNNLVIRKNVVRLCGYGNDSGIEIRGNGHLIEDNKALKSGRDGFNIRGNGHVLRGNLAAGNGRDGFDIDSATADGVTLDDNVAKGNLAEGIENNGTNTIITDNEAEKNRIDVANDGTIATFSGNAFGTGGQAKAPEID